MEWGTLIAVLGTLAGSIITGTITYFVQNRVAYRQRKWQFEDEKRRLKREILNNKLQLIKETAGLMRSFILSKADRNIYIEARISNEVVVRAKNRIDMIYRDAMVAVFMTKSKELNDYYSKLSTTYWYAVDDTKEASKIDFVEVSTAYVNTIEIIDNMIVTGEENDD